MVPLAPAGRALICDCERSYVQAVAACSTCTLALARLIVADCALPVEFVVAVSVIVPLPTPLAFVNVSHEPPPVAVQAHPEGAVTPMLTFPPV